MSRPPRPSACMRAPCKARADIVALAIPAVFRVGSPDADRYTAGRMSAMTSSTAIPPAQPRPQPEARGACRLP